MPLDEFSEKTYQELMTGNDQIIIGTVGRPGPDGRTEDYLDIVNRRRSVFEWLSKILKGRS
jgi:hypothetical protein